MERSKKTQRPCVINRMWEALKEGFYAYQTMPGYSAVLHGTKEDGVTLTFYDINEGTSNDRVCPPEDIPHIEQALVRIFFKKDDTAFDSIDHFFKPYEEHKKNDLEPEMEDVPLSSDKQEVPVDEDTVFERLIDDYETNSEVCLTEYLASEPVAPGLTYEQAFELYIKAMKKVEGDKFFTIKENETIEL